MFHVVEVMIAYLLCIVFPVKEGLLQFEELKNKFEQEYSIKYEEVRILDAPFNWMLKMKTWMQW